MKSAWNYYKHDAIKEFPQIAYGVRCMAAGLLRLYDATHDIKYAQMAGQTASWLLGNNAAQQIMYDSKTGRCLDGINDATSCNMNSGAESTIEALLTLVEISNNSIAQKTLTEF